MEFRLTNPHALVRRYMAGREPTPDELYRLARAATLAGPSNNLVLGYLEAAIRAEPGYRPASWLLAESYAHRGDYGSAVSVLERLTAVAPPVAEDYERLGTYALEKASRNVGFFSPFDPSAARRAFERCLELDPNRDVCLHGTNVGVSRSALGPGTLPVRP
jgi:Flp pilus assembly protein TadD